MNWNDFSARVRAVLTDARNGYIDFEGDFGDEQALTRAIAHTGCIETKNAVIMLAFGFSKSSALSNAGSGE